MVTFRQRERPVTAHSFPWLDDVWRALEVSTSFLRETKERAESRGPTVSRGPAAEWRQHPSPGPSGKAGRDLKRMVVVVLGGRSWRGRSGNTEGFSFSHMASWKGRGSGLNWDERNQFSWKFEHTFSITFSNLS